MRRTEFLIDQLNRSFNGDPWHGPSLRKLIDGIDEQEAKQHPLAKRKSIFELVAHIAVWTDVVARRVSGQVVDSATVSDKADPAASWRDILNDLDRAHARLCDEIRRIGDAGLNDRIENEILGSLQHTDYHAGQIAILKNAPLP